VGIVSDILRLKAVRFVWFVENNSGHCQDKVGFNSEKVGIESISF
jgi:hypothetical protein